MFYSCTIMGCVGSSQGSIFLAGLVSLKLCPVEGRVRGYSCCIFILIRLVGIIKESGENLPPASRVV